MTDAPMTMHSIDDNTGGSLGVMRHTGGVYLVIDDEGRTAAAGPFTRAQLDGLLDELGPVGNSSGPHVHYGGYHRSDDYPQGGPVSIPEAFRKSTAEASERLRLGRLVEGVRDDGHTVQVDRVKIAPFDTRGRTRDEVALQLQLDQEKNRHIATEQDRDELVDVQRHLTAHRAFTGCTDEDRPLLPAMLDRLDTLVDAEPRTPAQLADALLDALRHALAVVDPRNDTITALLRAASAAQEARRALRIPREDR